MEPLTKPPHREVSAEIARFQPRRRRWRGIGVVVALLTILGLVIWGLRNPNGLPDVGDPFDVAEARRPIAVDDDRNAFVLYEDASRKQLKLPPALSRVDFSNVTWSQASASVRDFVTKNRPALDVWRTGSELPDAIYHQPANTAVDTLLNVVQDITILGRLAGVEGSRHEEQAAFDEAWTWYRAMLRSSRQLGMHGVLVERQIGAMLHELAARRIVRWAIDPRVSARLLRSALDETLIADSMTPPLSEALKLEYLMCVRELSEMRIIVFDIPMPGGRSGWLEQLVAMTGAKAEIQRFRLRASNDGERSRRATRLLFANWLAQVDKPASKRAPIAISNPTLIYAADPTAPAAARAVAPAVLENAIDHSALARELFRPADSSGSSGNPMSQAPWEGRELLAREPRNRATLIVKLAAELYRRDHGQPPATAGALLGPHLKVLPEGTKRDDPISDRID
jgi:hypothetical protein